jgi:hypothetical protein
MGWPISDLGLFQSVKQLLECAYELRRFSGAVKLQLVCSMITGRQVSTPMVL